MAADVRLLADPFDPATALTDFARAHPDSGGVVSFLGQVRRDNVVEALELQHYAPMTLPGMAALVDRALERWSLDGVLAWHRMGVMAPGDPIVLVAAAARHRRDAFAAADFIMDHLKSESWFWKREKRDGAWHWIEPRAQDHDDLSRWGV